MSKNGAAAKASPLAPTGRELREPAATLVEMSDGDKVFTALRFDPVFHGHPALTVGIELIRSFLEYPMVIGLAEMAAADTAKCTYIFDTGPIWTLTEVLRRHRDIGQKVGVRAAFELAYLAGQILHEAGEIGPREGCYSHGNLTPWRIALRGDGSVQVFGYGIPPVEWICHRDDPNYVVDADSVRYAPPERLALGAEDPSSDSYALMLIVWEMITGEPLLGGHDIEALKKSITLSEAQQRVSKASVKEIPKGALDVIARCLIYDPDARLSGPQLFEALAKVLDGELPGDTLAEVMVRLLGTGQATPKGRKITSMQGTGVFTPQQLAAMADEDEDDAGEDKEETRWGKSRRRAAPAKEAPAAEEPQRRRRRSAEPEAEDEASPEPEAPRRRRRSDPEPEEDAAEADAASPRRRRRNTDEGGDEPEAKTAPAESEAEEPSRRRRRRSEDSEAEAAPEVEEAPAEDAAPRRRRRRSGGSDDGSEEVEAPAEAPAAEAPKKAAPAEAAPAEEPRRVRRRSEAAKEEAPKEETPDEEADSPDEPSPRRRRRRSE